MQGDMGSLHQGLFESLNELRQGNHTDDEYNHRDALDCMTELPVLLTSSVYRDIDGTQFEVAIQFS